MSSPRVSPAGHIHVLDYTPQEGDIGVPITVRINFYHTHPDRVFLRLLIGSKAVATRVRQLPATTLAQWQLDAVVPFVDSILGDKAHVSVQALDSQNNVIDSVLAGEFTFWRSAQPSRRRTADDGPVLRRRANTTIPTTESGPSRPSPTLSERRPTGDSHRRIRANSLMRTRLDLPQSLLADLHPQTPQLDIVTPLDGMCQGWDQAEHRMGRRLVRFHKMQDGRKLIVSCEPIAQEDYQDTDTVISCIYRQETQAYYVTSVDIIYLLERLTNDEFPVEEKNRIRRNLEGLRPITVSKHKSGFEQFFQRIMEFPDPKPRNIEKDLKVFEWGLLGQALDKIIAKYSIYTSDSPSDSTQSSLSLPSDLPPQSSADVDSRLYHAPDLDTVTKFEPLPDSLLFSQSHASSECPTPAEYTTPYTDYSSLTGLNDFQSLSGPYSLNDTMDYNFFAV